MRTRFGQVLWLIGGLLIFLACWLFSKAANGYSAEGVLLGFLAAPFVIAAYVISGPPWRL